MWKLAMVAPTNGPLSLSALKLFTDAYESIIIKEVASVRFREPRPLK